MKRSMQQSLIVIIQCGFYYTASSAMTFITPDKSLFCVRVVD